jgi:hypothetical protein
LPRTISKRLVKAVKTTNECEASFDRVAKVTKDKALMLILASQQDPASTENPVWLAKIKEAVRTEGFSFIQAEAQIEHGGSSVLEQAILVLAPANEARRL